MRKSMYKIKFEKNESFRIEHPDHISYLYFPIAGEAGIKADITPNLGGDSKIDQNTFLMEPVSAENLHNNRSTRNFWCKVEGKGAWSVTGMSAEEENRKFTSEEDNMVLEAGFMWHTITRTSKKYQLEAKVTSFVPVDKNVECMQVTIKNVSDQEQKITPIAAIPVYGRSADNIRDHRHVTSLLHQIEVTEYGIEVTPKLSFDERGHKVNDMTYYVCGVSGKGENPVSFYPVVEDYIGDGGNFLNPKAIREEVPGVKARYQINGKEALGGIVFKEEVLAAGQEVSYTIFMGITKDKSEISHVVSAYSMKEAVDQELENIRKYWQEKVNVSFHTGDMQFDQYMRWICFQPMLRRIYGCSFLPYHDYGKGGRGWRDLWQDCLSLLIMNPDGVRQMIVDNYGGVRVDGTNATIIGSKQGEFIADRNNITRVWMDHGFWPFVTTKFYIDQTGDIEILNEKVPYFKDKQIVRGTQKDEQWSDEYGMKQKCEDGSVYCGTILEHILLQQLSAFYEVGEHNEIRLRGADWNDALDMAEQRGESVAFTCAYAGNMKDLAAYLLKFAQKTGENEVEIAEEMQTLITCELEKYEDIAFKNELLTAYAKACGHNLSGRTIKVSIETLVKDLQQKADWMMAHIRKQEWVQDNQGNGWFNGYYDNHGRMVEGIVNGEARMMLTGQVFSIMSGTATKEQTRAICKSADQYLYEKSIGGYRLNTKFSEDKFDLGRMFGFAYGEKENGAVFSHMTVMYANALYKQGFAKEGYKALQTLLDTSMRFEDSKIYPGIPEYFDGKGRGMYHYLTGAASWYMLTVLTMAFGVRGELGDLTIMPKLMPEQFDETGKASVALPFMGKNFVIVLCNPEKKTCDQYKVKSAVCDGGIDLTVDGEKAVFNKEMITKLSADQHLIEVMLG